MKKIKLICLLLIVCSLFTSCMTVWIPSEKQFKISIASNEDLQRAGFTVEYLNSKH